MKRVVLASLNPVKARATENGFRRAFPDEDLALEAISVPSGVADQPLTDEETLSGARNRAAGAAIQRPDADFWIGLEGGIADHGSELMAFAWVVVKSKSGLDGESRTANFALPPEVTQLVRQGIELGEANDIVFERTNSKHAEGAVGLLTRGVIDRARLYEDSVVLALIPALHPDLYPSQSPRK